MIRLYGKYRLTFPVTPGEIRINGYGNDIETNTTIILTSKSSISAARLRSISFDFFLPGDVESPLLEVDRYEGPRPWLKGLESISWTEVLLTIDELDLYWNVLIGPVDGRITGRNGDYFGTIELPIFVKNEFVSWSNSKELLKPDSIITKQSSTRPNTSGKSAKKNPTSQSVVNDALKVIQQNRIKNKLDSVKGG